MTIQTNALDISKSLEIVQLDLEIRISCDVCEGNFIRIVEMEVKLQLTYVIGNWGNWESKCGQYLLNNLVTKKRREAESQLEGYESSEISRLKK